jgi:hypothetical protein
MNLDY